ncbi:MAG: M20/M25/M40 family metallo-hydrolase [Candidatus Roseilinea sp.]|uniref:M20/M25/M40 family metallo-hydrolase n=1 Tax=Candidatus Roseilinea sp. TaxID=2838777 RepID=UPI00404B1709
MIESPSPLNWDAIADEIIRLLQGLIRLDTSNPPGNEMLAARHIAGILRDNGIEPVVIETAPNRGNVIARLKGDGSARPILLYAHTDVVPVEPAHWSVDPFGGLLRDGYVYGRGALDMKGILAMQLAVFLTLARQMRAGNLSLHRDVILAATADEESDSNQGIGILVERHPDLLRAEYALSEFGGYSLHLAGKRFYPVQTAEKGNVWMRLRATGRPGHASVPHDDNAVVHLARAVDCIARLKLPMRMTSTARAFLAGLADGLGGAQSVGLRALLSASGQVGSALIDHAVRDPGLAAELRAITHNTVTPTGLRAGVKVNVIPTIAEATLDCRTLPGVNPNDLIQELRDALGDEAGRLSFEIDSAAPGLEFEIDTPLFRLIADTLKRHDPGGMPVPFMLTGATDAKHVARLGAICYGFSPMKFGPGERFSELVHGHDERVSVESLAWGAQVLHDVVSQFCQSAL